MLHVYIYIYIMCAYIYIYIYIIICVTQAGQVHIQAWTIRSLVIIHKFMTSKPFHPTGITRAYKARQHAAHPKLVCPVRVAAPLAPSCNHIDCQCYSMCARTYRAHLLELRQTPTEQTRLGTTTPGCTCMFSLMPSNVLCELDDQWRDRRERMKREEGKG